MTYYEILGIRKDSNLGEIKKAYKRLAKKYHPDVSDKASSEDFLRIQQAYQILSDPDARRQYDHRISQARNRQKTRVTQDKDRFTSSLFEWLLHTQVLRVKMPRNRITLCVEIVLSPEEARIGQTHILSPLLHISCPVCGGSSFRCMECHGEGYTEHSIQVIHHIPPGVYDGMAEYISLEQFGFPDVEIEVSYTVPHDPFA